MEISGLLVVRFQPKDEWNCVGMRPGAPFVMNSGQQMTLMWPVDSWDMLLVVRNIYTIYTTSNGASGMKQ